MDLHGLDLIDMGCFLRVQYDLFDRALLRLQRFGLADEVNGGPGDA
uniref:Uncharacterized protein n=1 Tax=Lepeophtheirus salmonis TaxID=72036 RepID=A0A0K2UDY1_LEPSM